MMIKKPFLMLIGMTVILVTLLIMSSWLMLQSDHLSELNNSIHNKLLFLIGQSAGTLLLFTMWPKLIITLGYWRRWDAELIHLLICKRWHSLGLLVLMQLVFFL